MITIPNPLGRWLRLAFATAIFALPGRGSGSDPAKAPTPRQRPGPEVLVVSDVYLADRQAALPQPDRPVYYIVLGGTEYDLGDTWAGEKMPTEAEVEVLVTEAMERQGYTRTRVGGPIPAIALIVGWGTASLATDEGAGIVWNRREISMLVGAHKAERKLMSQSEIAALNEAAREWRLYLLVVALDVEALRQKRKKIVWMTRMSIPALRNSLPKALATMLESGGTYFGRETELPLFSDDVDRRKGTVEFGELEILGTEEVVAPRRKEKPPSGSR